MNRFLEFYKEVKPMIEKSLNNFNDEILKENNSIIKENLNVFADLNNCGKMIRGTLIALGYKFNNEDINYAINLSTAYEIFETAILVHDDIIDNDILRRGKITVHAFNNEKYQKYLDHKHLSDSIGICIGDYGLYKANDLIVKNYYNDKNFYKILSTYNQTVIDTIRGEIVDVISPFEEKNKLFLGDTEKNVMDIYTLKTSYYTLVGPMMLGMLLGNNSEKEIDDIKKFTLPLGIAFQIQDDLLGIYSSDEKLGKTVGSDIKEFKQTLLYSFIKNTNYYDELLKHYGNEDYNLEEVQQIFEKSGAKDYAINKIEELYNESKEVLNNIGWLKTEDKEILYDLITFLKERKK